MKINGGRLYQLFKYAVYLLLTINVFAFLVEEFLAAQLQFPGGVAAGDLIEAYAATIDTAAWVILLLMFELETWVLDERHFTRSVTLVLHSLRAFCYVFIVYAFYGYVVNVGFVYGTGPLDGVADLCTLADDGWSYAVDLDEYEAINATNCDDFSEASAFNRFDTMPAVVDNAGLRDIRFLSWVDVINAGVWLLVLLVLEVDVRLQEKQRLEGLALYLSTLTKIVLYSTLALAVVAWIVKGDFVDWWDAFLWLVAFVFIEMNVFEWRQESHAEAAGDLR